MASKKESIYKDNWNFTGSIDLTLTAEERNMICNALVKASPTEVDIIPLMCLCDKVCRGEQK